MGSRIPPHRVVGLLVSIFTAIGAIADAIKAGNERRRERRETKRDKDGKR